MTEQLNNCGVEERSPYRAGMGEVVASSLRSLCFKCEETKVPGGLWLSDVNQQESTLLLLSYPFMSNTATPWTAARQASLFLTIS